MKRLRISLKLLLLFFAVLALPSYYFGRSYQVEVQQKECLEKLYFSRGEIAGYFLYASPEYLVNFSHDEFLERELGKSPPTLTEKEALNVRCLFEQPDYSQSEFSKLPPLGSVFAQSKSNQAAISKKNWLDDLFPATWQTQAITFVSTSGCEPEDSAYVVDALDDLPRLEGVLTEYRTIPMLAKTRSASRLKCLIVGGSCMPNELEQLSLFPELQALSLRFNDLTNSQKLASLGFLKNLKKLKVLRIIGQWSMMHFGHPYLQDSIMQDIAKASNLESLTLAGKFSGDGLGELKALNNLKELRFQHSNLTKAGMEELLELQQLKYLSIRQFSGRTTNNLEDRFSNLEYFQL